MCSGLVAFLCLISVSLTAKVKWIPNTDFNLKLNFKDGKLPCPRQTVVFPESLSGIVSIETKTDINGFVLPQDGELVIGNGELQFGPTENSNCTNTGNIYFLENSVSSWAQPDVWSSPKFNDATPDAERVPCFDDTVEFPAGSVFTISLPDQQQVVRDIKMNGVSYDTNRFSDYVLHQRDQSQQFILNQYQETGIYTTNRQCKSRSGCPCQVNVMKIDCSAKICSVPTCVDPIQPIGHCCKICGGVIAFDVDQSFDLMTFKELVESVIDGYGKEDLVYHIGKIKSKIQLVVVDKGEYTGTSAQVVNDVDHRMQRHWVQGVKEAVISGTPLYKYGLGGKIFVSMFFAVALVVGAVYAYYYKLPEIRLPFGERPGMFSRYQRRTDSVVSLTRRDSVISTRSGISTAFRNPMYDSKRGRVVVEASAED
ncbi:unnamed protein product [Colias eurytheme]|nr:unnamed protein product [Colias eurytheme]